jgi:hypothetical protein
MERLTVCRRLQEVNVERGVLSGRRESVEIAAITALEMRERSWIKTGVLVGLLTLALFGSDCEDDPSCDEYPDYGGFCC